MKNQITRRGRKAERKPDPTCTISASWIESLSDAQVSFISKVNLQDRDFPGGPLVRTPCFHCRGEWFDPSSSNEDPAQQVMWPKKKKKNLQCNLLLISQTGNL